MGLLKFILIGIACALFSFGLVEVMFFICHMIKEVGGVFGALLGVIAVGTLTGVLTWLWCKADSGMMEKY